MITSKNSTLDSELSLQMLINLPQGAAGFRAVRSSQGKLIDLEFLFLNPSAETIMGRKSSDLTGSTVLKHFPGIQKDSFFERLAAIITSGKGDTIEFVIADPAGFPKWIKGHCSLLEDGILMTFEDTTQQRRMEEQLRESQHFIQSITEASPEIIYVYDLNTGRNVYMNQRMTDVLGYSLAQAESTNFFDLIHPDDRIRLEEAFSRLTHATDNEIVEDEFRFRTASGAWRWVLNRMVVFRRSPEGYVWQVVGSARDITKRKRMDDELQQQQHLLASIADATPDIIMLMDLIVNRVVYVNRHLVSSGGASEVRLSVENEADRAQFVLQEDLLKRTAYLKGFAEAHNNETREAEYRMKNSQGEWRWYWIRGKVFRRLPDERVWQVILIGQDVTDKKEAQRQLKQLNEQLRARQEELGDLNNDLENRVRIRTQELEESVRSFRTTLETIPQMAWTALPDGQMNYYNQQWYEYTALTFEQSAGNGWLQALHPDDLAVTTERWKESLTTGKEYYVENRFRRALDGDWRWHMIRANPVVDENGKITLWVGTCTDTHDQKMALENLSHANAALDSFVHMAAHDLRSPVSNLKTLLQMLQNARESDDIGAITGAIESSALRLDNTIAGLIEILEVQTNYEIPARRIDLKQVVDNLLIDFAYELERCNGRVVAAINQCPSVYYVEAYLTSIIRNLLSNAIKYRNTERSPKITIKCHREAEFVVLTVSDNGIGMDLTQYGKQLFQPFTRLTTQAHGKGLGLHLMKNMIERNGGQVRVESKLNAGTTFHIYLREYGC